MPRYFAPVAGFTDKNITAIKIDVVDGEPTSHEVLADGTERPVGVVGHGNIWVPTWTEAELVKLVVDGKWSEVKSPMPVPEPEPAAPEPSRTARRVLAQPAAEE